MSIPVVDGFFTESGSDGKPHLLGGHCPKCGAYFFPKQYSFCRNPKCQSPDLDDVELGTRGTLWSFTDNRYVPPPPYPALDPFEPYGVAAVELTEERMVVLGQCRRGTDMNALRAGQEMELVVEDYFEKDGETGESGSGGPSNERARHERQPGRDPGCRDAPVGEVGPQLRRIRRRRGASGARRRGARVVRHGVRRGRQHDAQRLPRVRLGLNVRAGARLAGHPHVEQLRRVRVRRDGDRSRAGAILSGLADVVLVVGADTAPKGFFGPLPGERPEDPDWLRFHVLGATNPTYFGLYARRRMEQYGASPKDFATVKVKNSRHGLTNPYARYRKEFTFDEIDESPVVADPLRLVDICATSDGAAALVLASADFAAGRDDAPRHVRIAAVSTVGPTYPNTYLDMPDIATDSAVGATLPERSFRDRSRTRRTRRPGSAPTTSRSPRSTTCRPRSSSTGTRTSACARRARRRRCCTRARPRSAGASR